ncbi:MAG: hypothetical protein NVS9B15_08720 [Acidobacteriaceae bacterium]
MRLPIEYRFGGDEVFVRRDERTGEVILSEHEGTQFWDELFEMLDAIEVPDDFMSTRPMNQPPGDRDLFGPES